MKGKVLTKHRNLPTEEQDEAMSDYVDSMNLMTFSHDEKGYPLELGLELMGIGMRLSI
jgi:ATP-dependent DNA helicase 2 subunit 2